MEQAPQIYTVFFGKPSSKQGWPYQGFDCENRAEELFTRLEKENPQLDFVEGDLITTSEPELADGQIREIENKKEQADGCLYWLLALPPFQLPREILEGKPVVLANDLYGGDLTFLNTLDTVKKEGLPVIPVSSSSFEDFNKELELFTAVKKLTQSKVLVIEEMKEEPDQAHQWRRNPDKYLRLTKKKMGVEIEFKKMEELLEIYQSIDERQAAQIAEQWINRAKQVREPSSNEIVNSGKMYLAIKKLLEQEKANAFTMDCLDLFYRDSSPVLPCLAYSQLLNEGLIGTCEADLDSMLLQLVGQYLTGKPGFISDPVLDSGKSQIIYAHCVAPTKVYGARSEPCPSDIRSHAESGESAARQVFYPEGETVTTVGLNLLQEKMVLHQGEIVGNVENKKGCRTKVAARTDVQTLLNKWDYQSFGWHRVSFCGDFREQFKKVATLLGLEVMEEDK